mmetsp:Transcript_42901/g.105797  ORF Transcript_42901/g.105797 Transcript_42901/m.105797 type:complete len:276 (-) Transcript_42901:1512-2339(-)
MVALMSTTVRCGCLGMRSLSTRRSRSVCRSRSCTSSMTTCETVTGESPAQSMRSRMPVVQKRSRVSGPRFASSRTWYPTDEPDAPGARSPRSDATRSATEMAAMRRGWVQMIEHSEPQPFSSACSRMYCGSCVVLPDPVAPETRMVRCPSSSRRSSCARCEAAGRLARLARIEASEGSSRYRSRSYARCSSSRSSRSTGRKAARASSASSPSPSPQPPPPSASAPAVLATAVGVGPRSAPLPSASASPYWLRNCSRCESSAALDSRSDLTSRARQ